MVGLLVGIEAWLIYDYVLSIPNVANWFEAAMRMELQAPFVYRVLVPLMAQGLAKIFSLDIVLASRLVIVFSAIGFYFAAGYLYKSVYGHKSVLPPFLACQVLFLITFYHLKPYDYATAFFFALSLGLLARRKHGVFLALFPLATLNRETTFLLTLFYSVYFFGKLPLQKYLASLSIQAIAYLSVKFLVQFVFSDREGQGVYFGFLETISVYIDYWPAFLILALVAYMVIKSWKQVPEFVKIAILVFVPSQVVLHLMFGMPFEVRVFAESAFIVSTLSRR